jgi:catechol 2,3-dioxygenase-like lactoylglutathione lyase family enzyme
MKLGKFVELSIAVPDLAKSVPFYERLGFEKLEQSWEPWPWAVLTDGVITVNLSQATPGTVVLNYIASDMEERVAQVESLGVPISRVQDAQIPEMIAGMATPAGLGVSLLAYPARRIPRPSGKSVCKAGNFGELACPVEDVEDSVTLWTKLGFQRLRGSSLPYPWAVISDDLMTIGLHESRDLEKPALVYYSDNTPERIEQLEFEGFEFSGEIPSPDYGTGLSVLVPPDRQILVLLGFRDSA